MSRRKWQRLAIPRSLFRMETAASRAPLTLVINQPQIAEEILAQAPPTCAA